MISFDEALALVCGAARPLGTERVPLERAAGRVLAEDVKAAIASPRCDVSTMDGYAVRETDLAAFPLRLRIIGESLPAAGFHGGLEPGTCVRIFTGAPVPAGAGRVVMQEQVRCEGSTAVIDEPPTESRFIRRRGSDFGKGDRLVEAGRRLGPRELVAAAGGDWAELCVRQRPRLALIVTGDELVAPGGAREQAGAVPESVSYGLSALVARWGAIVTRRERLPDDLTRLEQAAAEAVADADLAVVTGGASVGERDFAKAMFAPLGLDLIFSKVAMKPGKPVWLGRAREALVIGLPGNPTSALVTARLLLAPLVAGLAGLDPRESLSWRTVTLAAPLGPAGDREEFVRARWNGRAAEPASNQDSGAQKTLAEADLLLRRRAGDPPLEAGATVEALDF